MYGYLADAMVLLHVLYVAYVVLGQLAIIVAAGFRWEWGRNRWFRLTHLLAIGVVAVEAVMGWQCPLTRWEYQLRELAGQPFDGSATFVGRMLHDLLFVDRYFTDGKPPEAFFTTLYLATLFVVLQGLIMYPPRLGAKRDAARPALV
ncbi:MAG: DUF2784 domain-containing protein [Gemmataceae bacterium]